MSWLDKYFQSSSNAVTLQGVGVSTAAPSNGQALVYDSGSGLWVPAAIAASLITAGALLDTITVDGEALSSIKSKADAAFTVPGGTTKVLDGGGNAVTTLPSGVSVPAGALPAPAASTRGGVALPASSTGKFYKDDGTFATVTAGNAVYVSQALNQVAAGSSASGSGVPSGWTATYVTHGGTVLIDVGFDVTTAGISGDFQIYVDSANLGSHTFGESQILVGSVIHCRDSLTISGLAAGSHTFGIYVPVGGSWTTSNRASMRIIEIV